MFANNNQRAGAMCARQVRELFDLAGAKDDSIGGGEFEGHHFHAPAMSLYFTPTRGSAIIGATVSRQAL